MRKAALSLAATLAVAWVSPIFAGAGLPRLGDLRAGPYAATLSNDSPTLVVGRNTLTLELPPEIGTRTVRLALLGPHGQTLIVPLRPVAVLGRAGDTNGGEADSHSEAKADHGQMVSGGHDAMKIDDHRAPNTADDQGPPASVAHDAMKIDDHRAPNAANDQGPPASVAHEAMKIDDHRAPNTADDHSAPPDTHAAAEAVLLRGPVDLPIAGSWHARMSVADSGGVVHEAAAIFDAVEAGPSRPYVLATGSLMVGALAVGAIGRRRSTATPPTR
ncbi:MAG: hypothetical protein EPO26_10590 [Chloroflexota bacterium]|nr:MAG: hypothetical protein EPO26_10590 [Chloroflexota bacterium]